MDHRLHLTQQAERFKPHNEPTSAAPDAAPSPELPAAPSIREAPVQQPLILVLPPPAAPHIGESSLPTLAAGVKRSATDAGLDVPFALNQPAQKQPGKLPNVIWHNAYEGNLPAIQAWLETPGIDVNAKTEGATNFLFSGNALQAAIRGNAVAVVRALLAAPGIDVPINYPSGLNLLRAASVETAPLILEALLARRGFKVNARDFLDRHQEFAAAAEAGDLAKVRSLLAHNPWLDINFEMTSKMALALLARSDYLQKVEGLRISHDAIVGLTASRSLKTFAVEHGHLHLFKFTLGKHGLDPNECGYLGHYLVSAATKGHFPIVQALLAVPGIKADVSTLLGSAALLAAIRNDHHQIAIVLAALPWSNCHGDYGTALIMAAEKGNFPLVRMLLAEHEIHVNALDQGGFTPLMLAAYRGHLAIVQALLAMPEIDVNLVGGNRACGNHSIRIAGDDLLKKTGNAASTALSLAKLAGRKPIIDALLAMPESPEFCHRELYESLGATALPARAKPVSKPAPGPEEKYGFLRQIVRPGTGADLATPSLAPNRDRLDAQRAAWLEQQCMAVILGTCAASDVPFLLQSTIPLPAWCQSSLANAIALGFTAGHYRSTPAPLWQPVLQTRAWLAGLAFGANQSRQEAIELDAGICHQLESMNLWNGFLDAAENLRWLQADPDAAQLDKLTMLGYAARDGDLSMIKTFIGMGANIHLRSANGDAPILIAAKAGQWAACAELVSLGAMPLMVDSEG